VRLVKGIVFLGGFGGGAADKESKVVSLLAGKEFGFPFIEEMDCLLGQVELVPLNAVKERLHLFPLAFR